MTKLPPMPPVLGKFATVSEILATETLQRSVALAYLEAVTQLVEACRHEHGGSSHEPECPICLALKAIGEVPGGDDKLLAVARAADAYIKSARPMVSDVGISLERAVDKLNAKVKP